MMRARAMVGAMVLTVLGLALAGRLMPPVTAAPAVAYETQKKGRRPQLPEQGDGATWAVTATNRNADQVLKFEIRMEDLVVYDPKTGEVIGKSEPLANDRARLILNDKSPFATTIVIRQEGRIWTGRAVHKNQDWTLMLRRLTR
jgi:hypothetical protein